MKVFFTLVFIVFLVPFVHAATAAGDVVVAQIGSKKITRAEFDKKYNAYKANTINIPPRNLFLEDLVRYEVGLQEAEKHGMEKDPEVQDRMRQELYKAFLEKELGGKIAQIQVSDKEMADWYKKNPEISFSHILIEFKPGSTPEQIAEAKKRATEIYDEVKKSKRPFEDLVRLYSDDPLSKQAGGAVGWQSRVTLVPSTYDATVNMKVGDIKGLVETPFGFHIIKLTGRHSFDEANKRQIRVAVFDEKRKEAFNEYFDKLKKQYTIRENPSAL